MIESRVLAGASVRPGGVGLVVKAYAVVLLIMVLLGWGASYLVLRLGWHARWPSNPAAAIPLIALCVVMFVLLGACVAAVSGTPRSAQGICSAAFFPLLFLSGAVFPIEQYPGALRAVAEWLPGYRVTELLAPVWVQDQSFDWLSLAYVCALLVVLALAVRWLFGRREDVWRAGALVLS